MKKKSYAIVSGQEFEVEDRIFDGLRLRTRGLAEGLVSHETNVIVLFYHPTKVDFTLRGVRYFSWTSIAAFRELIKSFKYIIFNYASMGLNELITDYLLPDQILIADATVPIELEDVYLNESDKNYQGCYKVLERSNYIIVSSKEAIQYFRDLKKSRNLSSDYIDSDERFIVCPFGLHPKEQNTMKRVQANESTRYVWYGGVYPWFDVDGLANFLRELDEFSERVSLHLVGIDSEFYQNDTQKKNIRYIKEIAKTKRNVKSIPWLPFNCRIEYLSTFDAAIFFNKMESLETMYSWRTRYTDFLLARLPLIVNYSDPFSSLLAEHGCAIIESNFNHKSIGSEVQKTRDNGNWSEVTEMLSWDKLTKKLLEHID